MAANADKTTRWLWDTLIDPVTASFDKVFNDANGTFTDVTANANSATVADVTITGAATTSILYFGMTSLKFDFMRLIFSTNPVGGTRTYEYWNGSTWGSVTGVTTQSGSLNWTGGSTHEIKWTPPSDWATTSINSATCYWIRAKTGTGYSTAGVGSYFLPAVIPPLPQMTVYSPETTSRAISSAYLKVRWRINSNQKSGVFPTQIRVSAKLGANAISYVMDTEGSHGNTSSNQSTGFSHLVDMTSYFQSNFGTGTSQTLDVTYSACIEIVGTTLAVTPPIEGFTVELMLTYEFDDTSQDTRIGTKIWPLDSNIAALTTSLVEMGTNQIPNLDTKLPESSKTYRQIKVVFEQNNQATAAGARVLSYALDSDAATDGPTLNNTVDIASTTDMVVFDLSAMTTNAVHALKAKTSSVTTGPYSSLTAYLVITYEYSHTSSTSLMNSIQPCVGANSEIIQITAGTASVFRFQFFVEEPDTITLEQSGIMVRFDSNQNTSLPDVSIKVGGQTARTYVMGLSTAIGGDFVLMHRIDSGGAAGAGFTLARGLNTIDVSIYSSLAGNYSPTVQLLLNYTSGKSSLGDSCHNHTVLNFGKGITTSNPMPGTDISSPSFAPLIKKTNYWINSFGLVFDFMQTDFSSQLIKNAAILAARQSGEGPGAGYEPMYTHLTNNTQQTSFGRKFVNVTSKFWQWPADWNSAAKLNPNTARVYKLYCISSNGTLAQFETSVTYHAITFTEARTSSGYSGDGSGITVNTHRSDTNEKVAVSTTAVGGGYSPVWNDDTIDVYDQAVQSGVGARSDNYVLG